MALKYGILIRSTLNVKCIEIIKIHHALWLARRKVTLRSMIHNKKYHYLSKRSIQQNRTTKYSFESDIHTSCDMQICIHQKIIANVNEIHCNGI